MNKPISQKPACFWRYVINQWKRKFFKILLLLHRWSSIVGRRSVVDRRQGCYFLAKFNVCLLGKWRCCHCFYFVLLLNRVFVVFVLYHIWNLTTRRNIFSLSRMVHCLRMLIICLRLTAHRSFTCLCLRYLVSLSPHAASMNEEKSSSPESILCAPGLCASLLPSKLSFKEGFTSDEDHDDSTPASGSTEGTEGCINIGGNATAERGASSRPSNLPSSCPSWSMRFALNRESRFRPRGRLADQCCYL